MTAPVSFANSYTALPERFFARVRPTPVGEPKLIALNTALAEELQLDPAWLASPDGVDMLSGRALPPGADPIATAYAGHQFGNFVPQLGDGRAVLLGEVIDRNGTRRDLQLKGAGRTPFSRNGDGRAAIGPVLREYLVSEAMAALGIPTTRALAAVSTGEAVYRETALPGAVLTRVASSHIRIGTFQFFAARGDFDGVRRLADHVIARHYPAIADGPQPYRALLSGVIARQARLVASWLGVGFIHGVMNTDNMSVGGETIDYGPCAFIDTYDPAKVFSSIDQFGRYAFGNQPRIALWNLTRLAECLLPLLDADEKAAIEVAQQCLGEFGDLFNTAYLGRMRAKLGLADAYDDDAALVEELLKAMAAGGADFTLTFRRLCDAAAGDETALRAQFSDPAAIDAWLARWRDRVAQDSRPPSERAAAMRAVNPAIIPRNHRIEEAIVAAVNNDFAPFERLREALSHPFEERPSDAAFMEPPLPHQCVQHTFCGT